jgi:hypothetical protein
VQLPPTKKEVVQALRSNDPDLLPYEHHPPFFSDAKDAPRQAKVSCHIHFFLLSPIASSPLTRSPTAPTEHRRYRA